MDLDKTKNKKYISFKFKHLTLFKIQINLDLFRFHMKKQTTSKYTVIPGHREGFMCNKNSLYQYYHF